ncbi:MAG: UDP-N-acetylglucosamine 4,6-dehydratase (inverting) [Waddliaceae bacterium]|jgi:UDP-N-acetylglucosamine 4,6-dehydratase/5-epimerase|nr:UDP-N-acetylglucosamine 4,6-dehydratase (inverting) [Waddliaceae bacterium]MBT3579091.1 UDP-N-acetylglucosamine 4,6-dehydratase (inverting) [Waddliaceae bacterium]MBT4444819.1 UDP-N-acetylglucosamine 4,6-dehydratase (inverting) [Waddliaceae bacterium]MBT6928494.1 UDP-N-acetylglucosamine 4,6-dehydratase (inverting) [Waddliaceae bacterium]MBT7264353.1 UDP-N-acetylglucosamine 4,6-dehydratase (inverting) [Waddliaceae bacterium]
MAIKPSSIDSKVILVTGGTGSFGRAFVRMLLEKHNPEKVIVFSRDECKQWEMRNSDHIFNSEKIRYFIGDVRDKDRLLMAFRDVDIVVHAAALKQIPTAEYNPCECVKTNVMGAMNVIDAAVERDVEKVIALSTDKAVNPANLYGATKLCSDKLFTAANVYSGKRQRPIFSVVRYGNVLGSRGSIVPMWQKMIEKGATTIPVTDERMTRFWITLEQATKFIMMALTKMEGGEIFVPKIPSMKVVDLAKAIAPEIPIEICGIRPGEKIHEVMVCNEDAHNTSEHPEYYVIRQHENSLKTKNTAENSVSEEFAYASDTNERWLTEKELYQSQIKNI